MGHVVIDRHHISGTWLFLDLVRLRFWGQSLLLPAFLSGSVSLVYRSLLAYKKAG